MVYVIPDSLRITPIDPTNSDKMQATAVVKMDFGNVPCGAPLIEYTKTYIHLLRRDSVNGQLWTTADEVAKYDCRTECCCNGSGDGTHAITFDLMKPANPGHYEFMAVDDADFLKESYQPSRVAKYSVTVSQDPELIDPCDTFPCGVGCPLSTTSFCTTPTGTDTSCASSDYLCQVKPYLPYIVGGAILLLLMTPQKKKE